MPKLPEMLRQPKTQAILACLLISIFGFGFRWMVYQTAPLDFLLEGDTRRIMTSGTMFNANMLRGCRDVFGDEATCGIRQADESEVAVYYEWTQFNGYIAGDASYDTVMATGKRGLGAEDENWVYPIEALLDLPNLKGWEVGLILWFVGPDTQNIVIVHMLFMALTTACVFGIGYFLGNIRAAIFASLIWTLHPSAVSNFMFGRQQIGAALFFTLACLFLILAFQRKRMHWFILSLSSFWIFSLYIYIFRPFLIVLVLLIIAFMFRQVNFKRVTAGIVAWGFILLLGGLALYPIRTAYLPEKPAVGEHMGDVVLGSRTSEGEIGSVYAYDNSKPILWLPPAPDDPIGEFIKDFSAEPLYYTKHNLLGIYRAWAKPAFPGYRVDDFEPHRSASAAVDIADSYPYLERSTEALAYHRFTLILALVGFIWYLGNANRESTIILGITILLISSLHGLFHTEDRYLFPQYPVLLVYGGLWLDKLLRLPRRYLLVIGGGMVLLLGSLALKVADSGFILENTSARKAFYILWTARVLLLIGTVGFSARFMLQTVPIIQRGFMIGTTLLLLIILLIGAGSSHWSDWSQEIKPNEIARQTITVQSIPDAQIPWLVVDIPEIRYPSDQNNFAISVNGQVVKDYETPMHPWFEFPVWGEGRWLVRYWLAIPLDVSMFSAGQPFNVDITTDSTWTMAGDFIVSDANQYYGPSLGIDGTTHKLGYLSYDEEFEYEPRIYETNDLQNIVYKSSWRDADGNWHTDDLARAGGLQNGRYRIYLQWQLPGIIVPEPITELPHP